MIDNGVNALDLIPSLPVSSETFTRAFVILEANFGASYTAEKSALLFDMIREDGWSEERFNRTFKWFLKNKPYPAWSIADWFAYGIKVYPYTWYLQQCREGIDVSKDMDVYEIADGTVVYKWRDGNELPLKRHIPKKLSGANIQCSRCETVHDRNQTCPSCYAESRTQAD